jgi:hypothetical protein
MFADIEEMVGAATELKRVLGELGETPFEPMKEEQDEEVTETRMEKQVNALNDTLINFLKGNVSRLSHHLLPACLQDARSVREAITPP